MKKVLSLAVCILAVCGGIHAQKKTVDAAQKLAGNPAKIEEARELIAEAMANPETADDARTYYVAGLIEDGLFDNSYKRLALNRNDPSVDQNAMYDAVIKSYNYFLKALPLDQKPNEKGQVKPKYTKDMANKIVSHQGDYFDAGSVYFNNKKYYPEAYEAFMLYGNLPEIKELGKALPQIPDSVRATAFFNAGLGAYFGNDVEKSAEAFALARKYNYSKPEAYSYAIACYQNMAQRDSTKVNYAADKIFEVAKEGYAAFGMKEPIFLSNVINTLTFDKKYDEAIEILNKEVASNPENPAIYSLLGFVYDRSGNEEKAEENYRKVVTLPTAQFDDLKRAARKLATIGTEKYNLIEGNSAEAREKRLEVKTKYFEEALKIAEKANEMKPNDSGIENIIESMQYNLETFFNK